MEKSIIYIEMKLEVEQPLLLSQRTYVQFVAHIPGDTWPGVTLAPGILTPSSWI